MLSALKRHPFAVRAFFDYSAVLTYALPAETPRPLLPPGLTVDEREGLGFIAVAMVKTRNLRPAFLPPILGRNFFLIGYRIFARFETTTGRVLRGLYILRSETDRAFMTFAGNLLTHYQYTTMNIKAEKNDGSIHVFCADAVDITFNTAGGAGLPAGSVFADWREARMFAGPLPFTFNYEPQTRSMVIVEGVRGHWEPRPAQVVVSRCGFFERAPFVAASPILSSAFVVEEIPYMWKKGRVEKVNA